MLFYFSSVHVTKAKQSLEISRSLLLAVEGVDTEVTREGDFCVYWLENKARLSAHDSVILPVDKLLN